MTLHGYALPGINIPTSEAIDPQILSDLREMGYRYVRIDLEGCDGATTEQRAIEILRQDLTPVCVLNAPEQLQHLPKESVALGSNEPDLERPAGDYQRFCDAIVVEAVRLQRSVYLGSISNLDRDSLAYLKAIWRPEWTVGVYSGLVHCEYHRYPVGNPGDPMKPQKGFASRDEEQRALRAIVGPHVDLFAGEVGYADQRLTEDQVIRAFRYERALAALHQVRAVCAYGLNDGPTDSDIDSYGFRTVSGEWKPRASDFAVPL